MASGAALALGMLSACAEKATAFRGDALNGGGDAGDAGGQATDARGASEAKDAARDAVLDGKGADRGVARNDGGGAVKEGGSEGGNGPRGEGPGRDASITIDPGSDRGCGPGTGSGQSSGDATRAFIEKRALAELERLVGQFVDGTTPVYRGTLEAHDNQSVLGPNGADQDIQLGPAVAMIQPDYGSTGAGDSLVIFSPGAQQYVQLYQPEGDPRTTMVAEIMPFGTGGGYSGPCVDCAPDFSSFPQSIVIDGASGTDDRVGLTTTVSANLTTAPPCSVTLAELRTLNTPGAFQDFVMIGDELVSHAMVTFTFEVEASRCTEVCDRRLGCGVDAPVTLDLFVNVERPWEFGVRNYAVGPPTSLPACGQWARWSD